MIIQGGQIYYQGQFMRDHELVIDGDTITAIRPKQSTDADIVLAPTDFLTPGFIDLHIHGANGKDVMDGSPASLQIIADALLEEGVTGFLATTMTESIQNIEAALSASFAFQKTQTKGALLLGVHLEGPFLSQKYMGAQCGDHLQAPDIALLQKWQATFPGLIKLITIAPELPGAIDFILYARSQGIVISIGHTEASFHDTERAIDCGASYATHLFNAMSGIHHREPGAAAALLMDDRVTAELILDGAHIVPEMVRFTVKCKGLDHLLLVTDAMRAKCLKAGTYDLGGQDVTVDDHGIARLNSNGKLAGSTLQLHRALKNMQTFTELPLSELLPLVTARPAAILNIAAGSLMPGQKADIVILNQDLNIKETLYHGNIVYHATRSD